MTYDTLKQIVLQKLFADPDDPAARAYLDAVPAAANEGLVLLAAAGLGADSAPLTAETGGETELPLPAAAAVLLPLYVASQLYKEDDAGIATQYRNEFEAGVETLAAALPRAGGPETWRSATGWL